MEEASAGAHQDKNEALAFFISLHRMQLKFPSFYPYGVLMFLQFESRSLYMLMVVLYLCPFPLFFLFTSYSQIIQLP